jgi:hypothetical protein
MLKQTLSIAALTLSFVTAAGAANANPLKPSYPTFAANIEFAAPQGSVEIVQSPLQPNFYAKGDASAQAGAAQIDVSANNPLHPAYKRS